MQRTILSDYIWRNRENFSQDELARRLGISSNFLSKLSNGHHRPSVKVAQRIQEETKGELKWVDLLDDPGIRVKAKNPEKSIKSLT